MGGRESERARVREAEERERQSERATERQSERERQGERARGREGGRERQRERARERRARERSRPEQTECHKYPKAPTEAFDIPIEERVSVTLHSPSPHGRAQK